jgi:hypothetical protein
MASSTRRPSAAGAEDVDVAGKQARLLKDRQVMGDVGGLAFQVVRDTAARPVALGDGGQDRVVDGVVPDVRFFGEQVAGVPPTIEYSRTARRGSSIPQNWAASR